MAAPIHAKQDAGPPKALALPEFKDVEVGQVIEAHTTDPGALTDFPAWARTSGNEIVKTEQEDKLSKFYIKRLA